MKQACHTPSILSHWDSSLNSLAFAATRELESCISTVYEPSGLVNRPIVAIDISL